MLYLVSLAGRIDMDLEAYWTDNFILQIILLRGKSKNLEINRGERLTFVVVAVLKKDR